VDDNLIQILVFALFLIYSIFSGLKKKNKDLPPPQKPQQRSQQPRPQPNEYSTYKSTQKTTETTGSSDVFSELEALFGKMGAPQTPDDGYTSEAKIPPRQPERKPVRDKKEVPSYQPAKRKEPLIRSEPYIRPSTIKSRNLEDYVFEPLSVEELDRATASQNEDQLRTSHEANLDITSSTKSKNFAAMLKNPESVKNAIVMAEILRRRGVNWKRA
jgi:hypothetical protein